MKKRIVKVLRILLMGFCVILLTGLIFVLCIRYLHSMAKKTFLETDYQIVYTFEELPEIVQKEILGDIHKQLLIEYDMTVDTLLKEKMLSKDELEKRLQYRSKLEKSQSRIANPGEVACLGDVIEADYPTRRMKYAGISRNSCFIYYVHGGFAPREVLAVYTINNKSSNFSFKVTSPDTFETTTIEELKENISHGNGYVSFDDKL